MIEDIARALATAREQNGGLPFEAYDIKYARPVLFEEANAAIIAALPHIKEAMEYHGVEGAMNKMIIKRLEDKCK